MFVCQFSSQVTPSLSARHVCGARGVFMGIPTRDILPPLVQHVRIQSCALDWHGEEVATHKHTAKSFLCALWIVRGAAPLANPHPSVVR